MKIEVSPNENLVLSIIDKEKKQHNIFLSYDDIMKNENKLIDGLLEIEVRDIDGCRKVLAVKHYSVRMKCSMEDSVVEINRWIQNNRCCKHFPYCNHKTTILESTLLEQHMGSKSIQWKYRGDITPEQAAEMQKKHGYDPEIFGFFCFTSKDDCRTWASNRFQPETEE